MMNYINFLFCVCAQCLIAHLDFMAVRRAAVPVRLINTDELELLKEMDDVCCKSNPFLSDYMPGTAAYVLLVYSLSYPV